MRYLEFIASLDYLKVQKIRKNWRI